MIRWIKVIYYSLRVSYLTCLRDRIVRIDPAHEDFLEVNDCLYKAQYRLRQLWPDRW